MTTDSPTTTRVTNVAGIGGAEIGRCLTRLHHDRFTPAVFVDDPVIARRIEAGFEHETAVVAFILGSFAGSVADLRHQQSGVYEATTNALADGVDLIVAGRMATEDRRLVGAPDLLVRLDDGYAAIEIKGHLVLGNDGPKCATTSVKRLASIPSVVPDDAPRFRGNRKRDLVQVAHYWRILDNLGFGTPAPIGGVIGTDDPLSCSWVDLDVEHHSILARTIDTTGEALEAIDAGQTHPDWPAVAPYWRGECYGCVWRSRCSDELIARDDPTLLQNVGPDTRTLLAGNGITTIAGVATLDPDTDLLPQPSIVLQARAKAAGGLLRRDRGTTPIAMHRPTRQIDFDIETYRGRIYLAGFLETIAGETTFDPIADWSVSPDGERVLVKAMFERLASYGDDDTKVFYWTSYEPTQLAQAAARYGLLIPGFESVGDWFTAHGVDLHRWTKDRFVSPDGYSLKVIAPLCGFEWRDDDPGGQQSEIWYEDMLAGDVGLRDRLLAYNEDDVAAQLAIRGWIDAADSGGGPGTAIRSVLDPPV